MFAFPCEQGFSGKEAVAQSIFQNAKKIKVEKVTMFFFFFAPSVEHFADLSLWRDRARGSGLLVVVVKASYFPAA